MSWSFVGRQTTGNTINGATTGTVTLPGGVHGGDFIAIAMPNTTGGAATTVSLPGFTVLAKQVTGGASTHDQFFLAYRIAAGTFGSATTDSTFTITFGATSWAEFDLIVVRSTIGTGLVSSSVHTQATYTTALPDATATPGRPSDLMIWGYGGQNSALSGTETITGTGPSALSNFPATCPTLSGNGGVVGMGWGTGQGAPGGATSSTALDATDFAIDVTEGTPAQLRQAVRAVRSRDTRQAGLIYGRAGNSSGSGRVAWSGGGPVRNPVPVFAGPARQAVRAPQPLPPRGRVYGNPGSVPPVARSGSAKALQRNAADKLAYLYDGSLIFGYWNGTQGQVGHITSPHAGLSVTNLITTTEDGISVWADNTAGTSSDIWVCSSDDDASGGAGPSLHVRHGTYAGGVFTWDAATLISGTTTAATIQSSITWNGTYLMVFWWDGASGSDRVSYAYTSTKNGTSGWSAAATLSESATWTTIVQVTARHSYKLGATVVVYGGNSQMHYACLADSATPAIGNWGGRTVYDQFDDSLELFGGPQVVIDENSGAIHVARAVANLAGPSWDGVIYWNGAYTPGTPGSVAFAARVTVASGATATGPADIAAAVDVNGTAWLLWTDSTTAGNLKYATLAFPFTSASAAATLIAGGAASNPRWPHVPAVSASAGGLSGFLPVLYMDTTGSPYPVLLNTAIQLPSVVLPQLRQAVRARLPQPPMGIGAFRGRVTSSPGAPVRNPVQGPRFVQKPAPVRFILPPWQPRAGRIGSSFGAPVINPIHGPPAYAPQGPARARLPQLQPRAGRVSFNAGAPLRNPNPGPVFRQATSPSRIRITLPPRGRVSTNPNSGAPVHNPTPGPVFAQAVHPAQSRIPQTFSKGRVSSNPGAPVKNPTPGPAFIQAASPARSRIPQIFSKGRVFSNPGAPVVHLGPVFIPAVQALRARLPVPFLKGRVNSNSGAPVRNPAPGPVFRQAVSPAQARIPQVFSKGRVSSNHGAPVQNPTAGPAFRQATSPARIRVTLPPRGRTGFNPGAPVFISVTGPPFYPLRFPARARIPQNAPRGRTGSNPGAPVRNPVPGPVFIQKTSPVQAKTPLFRLGRAESSAGILHNPVPGPQVYPAQGPVRVRLPQLAPRAGRVCSNAGAPVRNPIPGPVFRQAVHPIAARFPLPPKGRVASNPGAPVFISVTGPVFRPADSPIRARIPQNAPRGRVNSSPGAPVKNPVPGPVFHPRVTPARAVIPRVFSKGRAGSNPGAPAQNPAPGPAFRPAVHPSAARLPIPFLKGRIGSSPGAPVRNPSAGPAVTPLQGPAAARIPLPHRGRTGSNPGIKAPHVAPVYPWHGPVAARVPLPPRGRIGSNPGIKVTTPAPVYPWHHPVQARCPLPPGGRAYQNPGAPVHNPGKGPKVYPLHGPIGNAYRAPGPFRKGSTQVSASSKIKNPPPAVALRFRIDNAHFQWVSGSPGTGWRVP